MIEMGKFCLYTLCLLVTVACTAAQGGYFDFYYRYASCELVPGVDQGVSGTITMRQKVCSKYKVPTRNHYGIYNQYYPLEIYVDAKVTSGGMDDVQHGLHVHAFGDLSSNCSGAGGHYNPLKTEHGAPSDPFDKRHIGDWGNIKEVNGEIQVRFLDYLAPLYGPYSIYGRAIVLHEGADDLGRGGDEGSLTTGNAGRRLGCCIIRHIVAREF